MVYFGQKTFSCKENFFHFFVGKLEKCVDARTPDLKVYAMLVLYKNPIAVSGSAAIAVGGITQSIWRNPNTGRRDIAILNAKKMSGILW